MVKLKYNLQGNSIDISFPYDPNDSTILDLVKLLPDRKFINENGRKFWSVPVQAGVKLEALIHEFVEDCTSHGDQWELDDRVYYAIQEVEHWKVDNFILSSRSGYPLENKELDEMFRGILKPSQKNAAMYMFRNARGVINGNPDALRKVEVLATMEMIHDQPVLILCPNDEKFIWGSRVKLLTGRNVLILGEEQQIIEEARGTREAAQVVICNYGNLYKNGWLDTMPWRALVLDQSHHIRNSKSEQTLRVMELARHIPRKYLLSDTDYISRPVDIAIQLDIAGRLNEVFGGAKKFLARYQSYKETPTGWHIGEADHQDELDKLLRENCYVKSEAKDE